MQVSLDKIEINQIYPHILENKVKSNMQIEVEDLISIKQANLKITNGEKYAVLVLSGEFTNITKEARKLVASKEFVVNTIAKAILVQNLAQQIIANFYLKFDKPYLPTKAFSNREDAINWLKKKVDEVYTITNSNNHNKS